MRSFEQPSKTTISTCNATRTIGQPIMTVGNNRPQTIMQRKLQQVIDTNSLRTVQRQAELSANVKMSPVHNHLSGTSRKEGHYVVNSCVQRLEQQNNTLVDCFSEQIDDIDILSINQTSVISRKTLSERLSRLSNQQPIQRNKKQDIKKYRAGQWYSKYNPFKVFTTQKEARSYQSRIRKKYSFVQTTDLSDLEKKDPKSRYILKHSSPRAMTMYTYMMTKPQNQLSIACQGPHTVAFRVILAALLQADTVDKIEQIFKSQVPTVIDVEEIMKSEKNSNETLQPRIKRYLRDYAKTYTTIVRAIADLKSRNGTGLRRIKHLLNHLLNMHPYATYGWKSGKKASKKSTKGKGENVANPTFNVLCDKSKAKFNDSVKFGAFINERENLFDQYTPT